MAGTLTEQLIAHLKVCPCCKALALNVSKPEDGIPDGYVHETQFGCGARIVVTDQDDFRVSNGCPYPADDALQDFRQELIDKIEDEEGDEP